jgi:3-hydroxyacyl-[acyl-carrier-protein] dehydratase
VDSHELQGLIKSARRRPLWVANGDSRRVSIGRAGIERLIPHRDPFLFVDEITEISLEQQAIRGHRHVSSDDPVFLGHFPGDPIYPGVLQMEMIGQLGLCLMHFLLAGKTEISDAAQPKDVRALKIHEAQFLAPIGPGSDLTVLSKAVSWNDYTGICVGQVLLGETICSCCVLEVYFVGQ